MKNEMDRAKYAVKSCGYLQIISKQIGGKYHRFEVCHDCAKEHEKILELTRQNYQRQFGKDWH